MIKTPDFLLDLQKRLEGFSCVCNVCCRWKLCDGELLLPDPDLPFRLGFHDGEAFCMAVKTVREGEARCIRNDSRDILRALREGGGPFLKHCHAGALEIVIPVVAAGEEPSGVIMIGPFREKGKQCAYPELEGEFGKLPFFEPRFVEAFADLVPPLFRDPVRRAYVEEAGLLPQYPTDERMVAIISRLRKSASLSAEELAAGVYLSKSRLFHLFKMQCGISLGDYMLKVRLREARRCLLFCNWPIGTIAERTGFADQSHLTASFKREFGAPPLQYRRAYKGG